MPDITMCLNEVCPKAKHCYRSEQSGTVPNPWRQSYSEFNINSSTDTCQYYWETTKENKND